ncbi:MAG: hypothetical protein QOD06_1962 [Candidatus Binatota bacterium]|jgi:hypothetical protein|nr:hypothetical protein [Candidatus Binatota bacterium]
MARRLAITIATLALVMPMAARADILVLKDAGGRIVLTNLGPRAGFRVITRYREFGGSSGIGMHSLNGRSAAKYDAVVQNVATRFAVDAALVKAVIRAESNFNPRATSPKGAMGLMQLMPDTARFHGVQDAYDPAENVFGGVRHLRLLLDRYSGDLDLVLAAYNAGTVPVDRAHGIPNYPETREYVRRVREYHSLFRAARPAEEIVASVD